MLAKEPRICIHLQAFRNIYFPLGVDSSCSRLFFNFSFVAFRNSTSSLCLLVRCAAIGFTFLDGITLLAQLLDLAFQVFCLSFQILYFSFQLCFALFVSFSHSKCNTTFVKCLVRSNGHTNLVSDLPSSKFGGVLIVSGL